MKNGSCLTSGKIDKRCYHHLCLIFIVVAIFVSPYDACLYSNEKGRDYIRCSHTSIDLYSKVQSSNGPNLAISV